MNVTLLFLLLMILFSVIWHINIIKREKQFHSLIIHGIEEKIELEINKKRDILGKSKKNHMKIIDFKLSIVKQQLELLTVITKQNKE